MKDFKNFVVWQKSHQLSLDVYKMTHNFPKEELFGLTSQMKDPQVQFQLILLKVVEGIQIKILLDF